MHEESPLRFLEFPSLASRGNEIGPSPQVPVRRQNSTWPMSGARSALTRTRTIPTPHSCLTATTPCVLLRATPTATTRATVVYRLSCQPGRSLPGTRTTTSKPTERACTLARGRHIVTSRSSLLVSGSTRLCVCLWADLAFFGALAGASTGLL